jgi:hypothetical protein
VPYAEPGGADDIYVNPEQSLEVLGYGDLIVEGRSRVERHEQVDIAPGLVFTAGHRSENTDVAGSVFCGDRPNVRECLDSSTDGRGRAAAVSRTSIFGDGCLLPVS